MLLPQEDDPEDPDDSEDPDDPDDTGVDPVENMETGDLKPPAMTTVFPMTAHPG